MLCFKLAYLQLWPTASNKDIHETFPLPMMKHSHSSACLCVSARMQVTVADSFVNSKLGINSLCLFSLGWPLFISMISKDLLGAVEWYGAPCAVGVNWNADQSCAWIPADSVPQMWRK